MLDRPIEAVMGPILETIGVGEPLESVTGDSGRHRRCSCWPTDAPWRHHRFGRPRFSRTTHRINS